MPMNFTSPVTSDTRAVVLQFIRDHQIALAKMLDGETLTGTPTNAIRYNSGATRFEKFNGATWDPLALNLVPLSGGTLTGALVSDALGYRTPALDRPLVTKLFNAFTSGTYNGAGRWGLFMEPSRIALGYPAETGNTPTVIRYNADSSIANEWPILHQGNVGTFALPIGGGTLSGALAGTSAAFSSVSVGGNAVWHAGNFNPASYQLASTAWNTGNFNPASYAALSAAAFSGAVSASSLSAPTLTATGSGAFSGFQQRDNTSITWGWYATAGNMFMWNGTTSPVSISSTGFISAGAASFAGTVAAVAFSGSTVNVSGAVLAGTSVNASGLVYGRGGGRGMGQITLGTGGPSGGADGDVHYRY